MQAELKQIIDGGLELTFKSDKDDKHVLRDAYNDFKDLQIRKPKAELEIEIKAEIKHRTIDQNKMFWALLKEYGSVTFGDRVTTDEIETLYVAQLAKWTQCVPEKMLERVLPYFIKYSQPRYYVVKGYDVNEKGEKEVYVDVWFGSSGFDTNEMSHLIDGLLDDMEEAGINTAESLKLTKEWRRYEDEISNSKK